MHKLIVMLLVHSILAALALTEAGALTFNKAAALRVTRGADYVASGDFNEDGYVDLVVTGRFGQTLTLFLGQGNGQFKSSQPMSSTPEPLGLAVADFNRDGHLDVAVADQGSQPNTYGRITVLLGKGNGTFQAPIAISGFTKGPSLMDAADVNEDGVADLLVVDTGPIPTFTVLLGMGDGNFTRGRRYSVNQFAGEPLAADFNHDGHIDFAIPIYQFGGPNFVSLYLGNGDGTFSQPTVVDTGATSTQFSEALAAGDFNKDGNLDLLVCNSSQNFPNASRVAELLGDGTGKFQNPLLYKSGEGCAYLATADLDGDGVLDLVTSSGPVGFDPNAGVSVLSGLAGGGFGSPVTYKTTSGGATTVNKVILGDWNNDGLPDIAVASIFPDAVIVFLNTTAK